METRGKLSVFTVNLSTGTLEKLRQAGEVMSKIKVLILFTLWMSEPWRKLLREAVESPPLEILKSCLVMVLGNQVYVPLLGQMH